MILTIALSENERKVVLDGNEFDSLAQDSLLIRDSTGWKVVFPFVVNVDVDDDNETTRMKELTIFVCE